MVLVAAACGDGDTEDEAADTGATSTAEPDDNADEPDDSATDGTDPASDTASEPEAEVEDDVVVMCTVQEEWCEAAVAAFSDTTGVNAEYVRLSTGEGIARLEAEGDDPSFDVWFGGPSLGPATAAANGFIDLYVSDNAGAIPDSLKAADGTWTGIYVGALGFCSNAEILGELGVDAPDSYDDLLDPTFEHLAFVLRGAGREALFDTVRLAAISTPIASLAGLVIAFVITQRSFRGRGLLDFASVLGVAIPGTIIGIGLLLAYNTARCQRA